MQDITQLKCKIVLPLSVRGLENYELLRQNKIAAMVSIAAQPEQQGAQLRFQLCTEKGSYIPPASNVLTANAPFLQSVVFHTVGDLQNSHTVGDLCKPPFSSLTKNECFTLSDMLAVSSASSLQMLCISDHFETYPQQCLSSSTMLTIATMSWQAKLHLTFWQCRNVTDLSPLKYLTCLEDLALHCLRYN